MLNKMRMNDRELTLEELLEELRDEPLLDVKHVTSVRDRVTVVAVSARVEGLEFEGLGAAVCVERDAPSETTGTLLAFGRAVETLGREIKRTGWQRVERHR